MTETLAGRAFTRASLLKGAAGLVVAFGIPVPARSAPAAAERMRAPFAEISPASLDSWLAIAPSGDVTLFTGRNDSGQGKETAYAQLIADELDVPFAAVTVIMADTARTPDQGASSASDGLLRGAKPLRHAAADARQFLVSRAATRLGVDAGRLAVTDGIVGVPGDPSKRVSYAELIGGRRFDVTLKVISSGTTLDVQGTAPLKDPAGYRVVGTSIRRVDIPAKVTGTYDRVQNVRVPGMLHGRVVAPPAYGAQLLHLDSSQVHVDGGAKIVRKGNFVGVVAKSEWAAIEASRALKTTWSDPRQLVTGDLFAAMRTMPAGDPILRVPKQGDPDGAFASAATKITSTYNFPIQNHGMIGPSCAVVDVQPGEITIWSGTQKPVTTRTNIALMLGAPLENVRLVWHQTSGCYGRMTMDDAASAAALMSAEVRAPVRVQFMREDEHAYEPHIAPFSFTMRGALGENGAISVWDQDVWTWGLGPQSELPWILEGSAPPNPGRFALTLIGGGDAQMYNFPNQRSVGHPIRTPMVRSIDMRSPGYIQANFAGESFMDELAAAAGADPIAFRIKHAVSQRGIAVLNEVAKISNWRSRPSPAKAERSSAGIVRGRGVAVVSGQKASWIATVAEVEVNLHTGAVRPTRMFVAVDAGLLVNPDGLRNQVEGATIFGTSRALKEEMTWNASAITSRDWHSYPILRFSEAPEITISTINRIQEDPGGIGESPNTTPAAAIANAVFDATGVRLRTVPFTRERVSAALAAAHVS
jgi:nicotinate dehydrogenase subunit B